LQQLVRKLEAIEKKGGLKSIEEKPESVSPEALQVISWFPRSSVSS